MNQLTHVQLQFLQTLNIQPLQARPEIATQFFDDVSEVHNASKILDDTHLIELTSSHSENFVSKIQPPSPLTPSNFLAIDAGATAVVQQNLASNDIDNIGIGRQKVPLQILPNTIDGDQLLQDISFSFSRNNQLQLWQDNNLAEEFTAKDNLFFVRDVAVLQLATTKRQLWRWLAEHFNEHELAHSNQQQ